MTVAVGATVAVGGIAVFVGTEVAVAAGGISVGINVDCGAQAANRLISRI
jgi:hypothetical protein